MSPILWNSLYYDLLSEYIKFQVKVKSFVQYVP